MAELTLLSYRSGGTFLHVLDARVKLAALMGISTSSLTAGMGDMCLATGLSLVLLMTLRVSLALFLYEIRYFVLLLAAVFVARALSTPGTPIFAHAWPALTFQGVASGGMVCWRLLIVAILGLSLAVSTRPALIRQSVQWFLRPIPGVPHQKIGTMIGLLIRFMPVIWIQTREVAMAQRARCVDRRRNPIFRLARLSMSVLRKVMVSADRLAWAMEARNFGPERTPIPWNMRALDWLALSLASLLCGLMIW